MLAIGFAVGLPFVVGGLILNGQMDWEASYSVFIGRIPNLIATPFIASAYIALIMLWSRTESMFASTKEKFVSLKAEDIKVEVASYADYLELGEMSIDRKRGGLVIELKRSEAYETEMAA